MRDKILELLKSNNSQRVNGTFDVPSYQGMFGNCEFLAALFAFSCCEKGREILKKSIKINKNKYGYIKSYTVFFHGINEKYTISRAEMFLSKGMYSQGDEDMYLFELAYQKCAKKTKNKYYKMTKDDTNLDGVDSRKIIYFLSGKNETLCLKPQNFYKKIKNTFSNSNYIATFVIQGNMVFEKNPWANEFVQIKDIYGKIQNICLDHAYTVKQIDDEKTIIVNPWDTGKDILIANKTIKSIKNCYFKCTDL